MPPHAALAAAATPEQLCACAAAVMRGGHHAHVGGELVGVAGDADSQRLLKVSQRTICPLSHASRGDSGDGTGYGVVPRGAGSLLSLRYNADRLGKNGCHHAFLR